MTDRLIECLQSTPLYAKAFSGIVRDERGRAAGVCRAARPNACAAAQRSRTWLHGIRLAHGVRLAPFLPHMAYPIWVVNLVSRYGLPHMVAWGKVCPIPW